MSQLQHTTHFLTQILWNYNFCNHLFNRVQMCVSPVISATVLPAIHQPQTCLMNYALKDWTCHSQDSNWLCKFISNIFDSFIIHPKWKCFDRSNTASNCDEMFAAELRRASFEPCTVSSQIMRTAITILIGINKKWMMAQGTFANSEKEYQGITYIWGKDVISCKFN